jgi:nicotinate-nucleotide adenylyltransferase
MRIALFGGSFDPPHLGHIGIATAAANRLKLDRVLMAPVGRQPLKLDQAQSPYEDRLAMVRLASAGIPPLEPSTIDAPLPNGRFNYTYDALSRLRDALGPGDELFCLVGADGLKTLHHWHRAAEALMLAQWIIADRPGFPLDTMPSLLPSGVTVGRPELADGSQKIPIIKDGKDHSTIWLLPGLQYEISATQLREALAHHAAGIPQSILDSQVADYAREHSLYVRQAAAVRQTEAQTK